MTTATIEMQITDPAEFLTDGQRKRLKDALEWATLSDRSDGLAARTGLWKLEVQAVRFRDGENRCHLVAHYEGRSLVARGILTAKSVGEIECALIALAGLCGS